MTIAQRVAQVSGSVEAASRSKDFALYAAALMRAKGNRREAAERAAADRLPARVRDAFKADVAGGTTANMDPLAGYRPLSEGFAATLANVSAFDGVLADSIQVPLHTQFAVITSDATAAVAGEGAAKRVSSIGLDGLTLQERKAAAIIAVSDDLLRFNNAAGLLENSLRTGVAAAVDSIFVTALVAGTTPIASAGNIFVDLRAATDAAGSGSNSRFHLVVGPAVARHLALAATTTGATAFPEMTVTGGALPGGIVVHVSDALTDTALLVDANALAANADAIRIRISPNASLEMADNPAQAAAAGSPPAPVAATGKVVSMFQVNSTAILCERIFGFQLLRATAAQSISGVEWGLVGSPPA